MVDKLGVEKRQRRLVPLFDMLCERYGGDRAGAKGEWGGKERKGRRRRFPFSICL